MGLFYSDETVALHCGDASELASALPGGSIDCVITSPPYYGLRDYGVDGQYGTENSPGEYVENLRFLFRQLHRVLAEDGTVWLNLGDSYSSRGGKQGIGLKSRVRNTQRQRDSRTRPMTDSPPKSLLGIPWRVALALQDDGWILRNDVIWSKPNGMPESVTDRFSNRHEHFFLLSKNQRYWFDLDALREQAIHTPESTSSRSLDLLTSAGRPEATPPGSTPQTNFGPIGKRNGKFHPLGKNPGDVWTIPTQPFAEAHFAVMPLELARRAVVAGCRPNGTVLDPFSGSGTVGLAAQQNGRKYVGFDINEDYLHLTLRTRLRNQVLTFPTTS